MRTERTKSRVETAKEVFDLLQSIAAIVALILGAWWFLEQRSTTKNIKLDQTVTWQTAADQDRTLLVTVEVHATNIGKVKVDLDPGLLEITQINPQTSSRTLLSKGTLEKMRLEPGESAQALFEVFPVWDTVKAIQVYSCYRVPDRIWLFWRAKPRSCDYKEDHPGDDKENQYWSLLSVAEIGNDSLRKQSDSSVH